MVKGVPIDGAPEFDTRLRFAVLWLSLVGATASMYRHVADLVTGSNHKLLVCLGGGFQPEASGGLQPGTQRFAKILPCADYLPEWPLLVAVLGVVVLVAVTTLVTWAMPAQVVRRRHLAPLDPRAYPRTHAYLVSAEHALALSRRPRYWVRAGRPGARDLFAMQGRAFGSSRRPGVFVNPAFTLSCEQERPDQQARAVVLHELAHVRRGDLSRTQVAVASWWGFLVVAVIPFAAATLWLSRWRVDPAAAELRTGLTALLLVALVYIARAAVLRGREFSADALAGQVDRQAMSSVLTRATTGETRRFSWRGAFGWHPSAHARRRVFERPQVLIGHSVVPLLLAGVMLGVISTDLFDFLTLLVRPLWSTGWIQPAAWLFEGLVAALLTVLVVAAGWLWAFGARTRDDAGGAVALWPGVLIAAGFVIGEPLAVYSAISGIWGTLYDRGWHQVDDELISFGLLSCLLVGLFSWSGSFALLWLSGSRSVRLGYAVSCLVGGIGAVPLIVCWVYSHKLPFVRQLYWPGHGGSPLLHASDALDLVAPGLARVEAEYFPLAMAIRMHSGRWLLTAPLVAVPFVAWSWLAARATPTGLWNRRRAGAVWWVGIGGVACSALVVAGFELLLHRHFRDGYLGEHSSAATSYVASVALLVLLGWALLAGTLLAVRLPTTGPVLGVLAGLLSTLGFALLAPLLIRLGVDGHDGLTPRVQGWPDYRALFGLIVVQAVPLVVLAGLPVWALVAGVSARWRSTQRSTEQPANVHGPQDGVTRRASFLAWAGGMLVWAAFLVAAYFGESAFPTALGISILTR